MSKNELERSVERYAACSADAIASGSKAQMMYFIEDAKKDIASLARIVPDSKASLDVLAERRRQMEVEGWTPAHDDQHTDGALAKAATCYASVYPLAGSYWPWDIAWWKPSDRRRNLIKAAALLLAEIERLDRSALSQGSQP